MFCEIRDGGLRRRRCQAPCAIHDGRIHLKGVTSVTLRVKLAMAALTDNNAGEGTSSVQSATAEFMSKGVEVVTLHVESLNGKGAGEVKFLVQSAIAEIMDKYK